MMETKSTKKVPVEFSCFFDPVKWAYGEGDTFFIMFVPSDGKTQSFERKLNVMKDGDIFHEKSHFFQLVSNSIELEHSETFHYYYCKKTAEKSRIKELFVFYPNSKTSIIRVLQTKSDDNIFQIDGIIFSEQDIEKVKLKHGFVVKKDRLALLWWLEIIFAKSEIDSKNLETVLALHDKVNSTIRRFEYGRAYAKLNENGKIENKNFFTKVDYKLAFLHFLLKLLGDFININNKEKSMLISIVIITICSSLNIVFSAKYEEIATLLVQKIGSKLDFTDLRQEVVKVKEDKFSREFIVSLEKGLRYLCNRTDISVEWLRVLSFLNSLNHTVGHSTTQGFWYLFGLERINMKQRNSCLEIGNNLWDQVAVLLIHDECMARLALHNVHSFKELIIFTSSFNLRIDVLLQVVNFKLDHLDDKRSFYMKFKNYFLSSSIPDTLTDFLDDLSVFISESFAKQLSLQEFDGNQEVEIAMLKNKCFKKELLLFLEKLSNIYQNKSYFPKNDTKISIMMNFVHLLFLCANIQLLNHDGRSVCTLMKHFFFGIDIIEHNIFNQLLRFIVPTTEGKTWWDEQIIGCITNRIKTSEAVRVVEVYSSTNWDGKEKLHEIWSDTLGVVIELEINKNSIIFSEFISSRATNAMEQKKLQKSQDTLQAAFSKAVVKMLPSSSNKPPLEFLHFILFSKFIPGFFKFYDFDYVNPVAKHQIIDTIQFLQSITTNLTDSSIKLQYFYYLQNHQKTFTDFVVNHRNTLTLSDEIIQQVTESFSAIMGKLERLDNERRKIRNALDVDSRTSIHQHLLHHIIMIDHDDKTVNQISELQRCQEFQHLLENSENILSKLALNVQSRKIDIHYFESIIFSTDLKDDLLSRSLSVELDDSLESERYKIEHLLSSIDKYEEGASAIIEIIDIYFYESLNYSFAVKFLDGTKCINNTTNLESLTPQIYEWLAIFLICGDKKELLNAIARTHAGIKWLKSEIGTKEDLNAFIELADIAAGENDVDIDQIQALTLVGNMLWPFLQFEREHLNRDKLDDSNEMHVQSFLIILKGMFKDYSKYGTSLTSKILDLLGGDFNWIKNVKASHGSVETTSVSKVQNLFKNGKFILSGNGTLNNCLFLYDTEIKEYSYLKELKELYNRIMLISTERKTDDVERFSMLFEQLLELSSKLRKIFSRSVPLFSLMRICVDCRNGFESINITFDLKFHEVSISAHRDNLCYKLSDLSINLSKVLEKWEKEVEVARHKYTLFDNFSSVQLVSLCQLLPLIVLPYCLKKNGSNDFPNITGQVIGPEVIIIDIDSSDDQSNNSFDDDDSVNEDDVENMDGLRLPKKRSKSQAEDNLNVQSSPKRDVHDEVLAKTSENIRAKVQWLLYTIDAELTAPLKDNNDWKKLFVWVEYSLSLLDREVDSFLTEESIGAFDSRALQEIGFKYFSENKVYDYNCKYIPDIYGFLFQSESSISRKNFHIKENRRSDFVVEEIFNNIWTSLMQIWSKTSILFIGGYNGENLNGGLNFESLSNLLILWHDKAQQKDEKLIRCCKSTNITLSTKYLPKQSCNTNADNGIVIFLPKKRENVIDYVLEISMHSGNIPHYQKTLVCSPDTSFDELRIFLQRFVFSFNFSLDSKPSSIVGCNFYYLIHIQKLNYIVAEKSVSFLKEKLILQSVNKGRKSCVRLFGFCSEEDARSSVFASSFYSSQLMVSFLGPAEKRTEFLHNLIPDYQTRFKCFHSNVSGNGKTWFIRKNILDVLNFPQTAYLKIPLTDVEINETNLCLKLVDFYSCEEYFDSQNDGYLFKSSRKAIHLVLDQGIGFQNVTTILFKLIVLGQLQTFDGAGLWKLGENDLVFLETSTIFTKVDFGQYLGCFRMRTPYQLMKEATKELSSVPYIQLEGAGTDEKFKFVAFMLNTYLPQINSSQVNNLKQNVTPYISYRDFHKIVRTCVLHCGIDDPSWALLSAFVSFFYQQLKMCENSIFTQLEHVQDIGLYGFKNFVIRFMLQMSRDFAMPSISEDILRNADDNNDASIHIRRKWETEAHPYLTFNEDGTTMTFLGFNIERSTGNLVTQNNVIIEKNVMDQSLFDGLQAQGVILNENFESFSKSKKISKLLAVFGFNNNFCSDEDPDPGFELTSDNCLKMLAIHLRFRCRLPVAIFGETGIGKTRLIVYYAKLCMGTRTKENLLNNNEETINTNNILIVKVHGGIEKKDIHKVVADASATSEKNFNLYGIKITILFFDECNTSYDAIWLTKEMMCDGTCEGTDVKAIKEYGLRIVIACNPYVKHTEERLKRLERAGLGYHNKEMEMDTVPLRHLVYRVHKLPLSLHTYIYDFGKLSEENEQRYVRLLIERSFKNIETLQNQILNFQNTVGVCQSFMRGRNNEKSFVSLRDVERFLQVFHFFFSQLSSGYLRTLLQQVDNEVINEETTYDEKIIRRSTIYALGVAYYLSLNNENRDLFIMAIQSNEKNQIGDALFGNTPHHFKIELDIIMKIFVDQLDDKIHKKSIAKNAALTENTFLMIVCAELRIPLFVVGKPGMSKSLSRTLVQDAMKGEDSTSCLFKQFKQQKHISYQCSPLSTSEGIIRVFRDCSRNQQNKDLDNFVSVAVLDEIGLAEDSNNMALKALHPLLENGCSPNGTFETYSSAPEHKVSFFGISNWSLDPAKMNRGILVSREEPDRLEALKTAESILTKAQHRKGWYDAIDKCTLEKYVDAYLNIYNEQEQEIFGLRDFYSFIKMIGSCGIRNREDALYYSLLRNFSSCGLSKVDAVVEFCTAFQLPQLKNIKTKENLSVLRLLRDNIAHVDNDGSSPARYPLIITRKGLPALSILRQWEILGDNDNVEIIFGSSFPDDNEYTSLCRSINRVKLCLESGRKAVLINLSSIYESIYDALNQYYMCIWGNKYVDLGLGSHRVKCRVHSASRLIIMATKEEVQKEFPIPLINRLEKHQVLIKDTLNDQQKQIAEELMKFVKYFEQVQSPSIHLRKSSTTGSSFIGFDEDTAYLLVTKVISMIINGNKHTNTDVNNGLSMDEDYSQMECNTVCHNENYSHVEYDKEKMFLLAQDLLLDTVTPDAMIRYIANKEHLGENVLMKNYSYKEITHDFYFLKDRECILTHLQNFSSSNVEQFMQITTFARLLTNSDIKNELGLLKITLLSLNEIQSESQLLAKLEYFKNHLGDASILVLQYMESCYGVSNSKNGKRRNLIECTRFAIQNSLANHSKRHSSKVLLLIQLPLGILNNKASEINFVGQPSGWKCLHLDELINKEDSKSFYPSCSFKGHLYEWLVIGQSHNKGNTFRDFFLLNFLIEACSYLSDNTKRHAKRDVLVNKIIIASDSFSGYLFNAIIECVKIREQKMYTNKINSLTSYVARLFKPWNTFQKTMMRHVEKIFGLAYADTLSILDRCDGLDLILDIVDTRKPEFGRNVGILNGSLWMILFREIIVRLKDDFCLFIGLNHCANDMVPITGVYYNPHAAFPTETVTYSVSGKKKIKLNLSTYALNENLVPHFPIIFEILENISQETRCLDSMQILCQQDSILVALTSHNDIENRIAHNYVQSIATLILKSSILMTSERRNNRDIETERIQILLQKLITVFSNIMYKDKPKDPPLVKKPRIPTKGEHESLNLKEQVENILTSKDIDETCSSSSFMSCEEAEFLSCEEEDMADILQDVSSIILDEELIDTINEKEINIHSKRSRTRDVDDEENSSTGVKIARLHFFIFNYREAIHRLLSLIITARHCDHKFIIEKLENELVNCENLTTGEDAFSSFLCIATEIILHQVDKKNIKFDRDSEEYLCSKDYIEDKIQNNKLLQSSLKLVEEFKDIGRSLENEKVYKSIQNLLIHKMWCAQVIEPLENNKLYGLAKQAHVAFLQEYKSYANLKTIEGFTQVTCFINRCQSMFRSPSEYLLLRNFFIQLLVELIFNRKFKSLTLDIDDEIIRALTKYCSDSNLVLLPPLENENENEKFLDSGGKSNDGVSNRFITLRVFLIHILLQSNVSKAQLCTVLKKSKNTELFVFLFEDAIAQKHATILSLFENLILAENDNMSTSDEHCTTRFIQFITKEMQHTLEVLDAIFVKDRSNEDLDLIKMLQSISKLRFCIRSLTCIVNTHTSLEVELRNIEWNKTKPCNKMHEKRVQIEASLSLYFIRCIFQRHGFGILNKKMTNELKWVLEPLKYANSEYTKILTEESDLNKTDESKYVTDSFYVYQEYQYSDILRFIGVVLFENKVRVNDNKQHDCSEFSECVETFLSRERNGEGTTANEKLKTQSENITELVFISSVLNLYIFSGDDENNNITRDGIIEILIANKWMEKLLIRNTEDRRGKNVLVFVLNQIRARRNQNNRGLNVDPIIQVIIHVWVILSLVDSDDALFLPFKSLIEGGEEAINNLYLPCMEGDEFPTVANNNLLGVTKWYQCSCGEQYGVGDCGNLSGQGQCSKCKKPIGASSNNAQGATNVDRTRRGHILLLQRDQETGQRQLTRSEYYILLSFLHIALYLEKLLSEKQDKNWLEHLITDVRGLSNSMNNLSIENTCLYFHCFLKESISVRKMNKGAQTLLRSKVFSYDLNTCWQSPHNRLEWESFIKRQYLTEVLSDVGKEEYISPLRQCILEGAHHNSKSKLQTLLLYLIQEKRIDIVNPESIVDNDSLFSGDNALWNVRDVTFSIQQVTSSYNTHERNSMLKDKHDSILDVLFRNHDLNLFSLQKLGELPSLLQFRNEIVTSCYKKEEIEDALLQVVTNTATESSLKSSKQYENSSFHLHFHRLSTTDANSTTPKSIKYNTQLDISELVSKIQTIAHAYNIWPFQKKKFDTFQSFNMFGTVLDRVIDYMIRDHNNLRSAATSRCHGDIENSKKEWKNEIVIDGKNKIHTNDLAIVDVVADVVPLSLSLATYSRNLKNGRTFLKFDFAALEILLNSKYDLANKPYILNRLKPKVSNKVITNDVKASQYTFISVRKFSSSSTFEKDPFCLNVDFHIVLKLASDDISRTTEYIAALETLIRFACRHHKYKYLMKSVTEEYCIVKLLGKFNEEFFDQRNEKTLQAYYGQFSHSDHNIYTHNEKIYVNNVLALGNLFQHLKDKSRLIFLEDALDLKLLLELKRSLLLDANGVQLFSDKFNVRIYNKALNHPSVTNKNAYKYFCLSRYLLEILQYWEKKEFEYYGIDDEMDSKNSLANPNSEWSLKDYLAFFHNNIVSESIIDELVLEEITVGESSSYFLKVVKFCFPYL